MRTTRAQLERLDVRLAIALFTSAVAMASAQQIAIAPRLRAGDEFRLEVKRTRQNSSRPQPDTEGVTPIDIRVVSASAAGFDLEWIPGDTRFSDSRVAQDPLFNAASQALKGLRLRIRLSPDGEFAGLTNQAEVAPKLQAAVDVIMRAMAAKLPGDQRETFQSLAASILSPTALVATVTNDAQTYFGLNGVTISIGESIEVPIQQPNPLGGRPIPATFNIRAEAVTKDGAVLSTTTTYSPATLREVTRSLLVQVGKSIPQQELDKLPPLEMRDDGKFVFDQSVGLMREVNVTRRMVAGPTPRLDNWEIRLVKSPTR